MLTSYALLCAHILGACIWVGGHLVLALGVLPRALAARDSTIVTEFEARFERLGLPALVLQVVTGLWLAERLLGSPDNWFGSGPIARVIQIKLLLLVATLLLAAHARLRLIPQLNNDTLPALAWHIRAVTSVAVLLVLAGATIRFGGYPLVNR